MCQRSDTADRSQRSSGVAGTRRGERGSALVVALMVIFSVTVLGSIMAMISSVDLKISGNQRGATRALYAAEAGLNEAIHRLSLPDPTVATVGGWTGNAAISDTPPYDPDWTARIYLTAPNAAPAPGASEFNTGTLQDLSGAYFQYSRPSGTEEVLTIRHKWSDLNGDGVRDADEIVLYDPAKIPTENFTSGLPIEVITATGRAAQGRRTILAEVAKMAVSARSLGALYTDKAIDVTGTPAFCGFNHDIAIPDETAPNACFGWHLATGHMPGITTTGDVIRVQGNASDIEGHPAPTDTSSSNPFYSLAEVLGITDDALDQILANAHNTSITNPLNGITYIQGDATINANLVGEGLLYVTGDFVTNGDFQYEGLIYVEGDLKATGNPWILGSLVVRGTSDYNFSAGNAAVLYCSDAIRNTISQFLPMVRLSWREI